MRLKAELLNLIHNGRYDEAQEQIDIILTKFSDDKYNLAIGLFYQSWLQRARGLQLTECALITTAELISIARETQDPYLMGLYLFRRGDISFCKGRLTQAKTDWEDAEDFYKKVQMNDAYEVIWLKYHLALVYRDLYGYQVAIPLLQEILNLKSCSYAMKYKIYRELFFCFCYLKEYKSAYKCFETLQYLFKHDGLIVDFKIFKAHLNILKRNFKGARVLLLEAVTESRHSKIGRNRYDFSFHLAYFYSQKKDYTRMFHFISVHTDPIYKLQLYNIAIAKGKVGLLREYETLAFKIGITQHIKKSYVFRKMHQRKIKLQIDLEKIFQFKQPGIDLLVLLATTSSASKDLIAREVFHDSFYQSSYHDPKIYKLVSQINSAGPTISNQKGRYQLNLNSLLSAIDAESIKVKIAANKLLPR